MYVVGRIGAIFSDEILQSGFSVSALEFVGDVTETQNWLRSFQYMKFDWYTSLLLLWTTRSVVMGC